MNLIDVAKQFATPEACNDFLEQIRWPDGVECVHCGSKNVSKYIKKSSVRKSGPRAGQPVPARILYVCRDCKKQFSATEGTIFGDTHLPIEKWFMATALMVNAKKGVSAKQIQRDLGVAYKTAWYLAHRIRKAMGLIEAADETPLSGTVEADETYMGAKKYDRRVKRGRYVDDRNDPNLGERANHLLRFMCVVLLAFGQQPLISTLQDQFAKIDQRSSLLAVCRVAAVCGCEEDRIPQFRNEILARGNLLVF
jgi:transposase-like protein